MFYSTKSVHHLLTYYTRFVNSSSSYHEFHSLKNRFVVSIGKANTSKRKQIFNKIKRESKTIQCFKKKKKTIHAKEKQFRENQYQEFIFD